MYMVRNVFYMTHSVRSSSLSNAVALPIYRYSCTDNQCSVEIELSHTEAVGCSVFCKTDANGDGEVTLAEKEAPFLRCTGGDRG